jgi:hypothetical protein
VSAEIKTDKGYFHVRDDVAFRTSAEAASCFGKFYKRQMRGSVWHPKEAGKIIWFPKMYPNGEWNNRISDDGKIIWEINESPEKARDHIDGVLQERVESRIVFAHEQSPTGRKVYRFKGEFKLDREATNYKDGLVWRRISEWVKTYPVGSEH